MTTKYSWLCVVSHSWKINTLATYIFSYIEKFTSDFIEIRVAGEVWSITEQVSGGYIFRHIRCII